MDIVKLQDPAHNFGDLGAIANTHTYVYVYVCVYNMCFPDKIDWITVSCHSLSLIPLYFVGQ